MARSDSTKTAVSFVLAVALVVILAAFAAVAASTAPTPAPSDGPTATPVITPDPTAEPTPIPTPEPTVAPEPSADPTIEPQPDHVFSVDLDTADDNEVDAFITDASKRIVAVRSGRAADGMSVRWGEVAVENVDEDTLRFTWSGWAHDEVIQVAVTEAGDGLFLSFTQKLPLPNTDAMGADRVLVIDVDEPISAEDVSAEFVAAE